MSNNLLWKSLQRNQVHIKEDDIAIDELFQIIRVGINTANYIVIKIFTPLNYTNTYEFISHNSNNHSNTWKYFRNKKGKIIQFMLDAKKCIHINKKHNRLRKALYYKK